MREDAVTGRRAVGCVMVRRGIIGGRTARVRYARRADDPPPPLHRSHSSTAACRRTGGAVPSFFVMGSPPFSTEEAGTTFRC